MSQPASRPAPVRQIDHVTFVVKDLAASHRFYAELLGMASVPRPAFSFQGQWFQAGSTLIHTILEHDQSGPAGLFSSPSTRSQHLAFLVEDARAYGAWLSMQGVPLVSGPKRRPDGAWQTFVHDPDGHLVELTSSAEPPADA